MVKCHETRSNELMCLMGLWAARAGAARPRCPQACLTWGGRSAGPVGAGPALERGAQARGGAAAAARRGCELLSRELGVPIYKLEQWRQKADAALEGALKERESDPANGELAAAMQRIGELSMEVELLRAKIGRPGPLARRRSR